MRRAFLAALVALANPAAGLAQKPPQGEAAQPVPAKPAAPAASTSRICVSPADFEAVLVAALPDLLTGLSNACRASLPATALLAKGGDALTGPYDAAAREIWPKARQALGRIARQQSIPIDTLGDDGARAMLKLSAAMLAGETMGAGSCTLANELVEQVRPLPAANLARAMSVIVRWNESRGRPMGGRSVNICQPPRAGT